MPDPSQPYRDAAKDAAPANPQEIKPYVVVGKTEWADGYEVHLQFEPYPILRARVTCGTFHETNVGDYVFVRLEKAPPPTVASRPIPGPGRDSRP